MSDLNKNSDINISGNKEDEFASNTNLSVQPYVIPAAEKRELDDSKKSDIVISETKDDVAKSVKEKRIRPKMGKKQKIAIIIIAIVLVLAIAGGTVLAVVLLTPQEEMSDLIYSRYEYAMSYDDTVGITVDDSWRGNWTLAEFTLVFDSGDATKISISEDNKLKFVTQPDVWETFEFSYYLGDSVVAEYVVTAVEVEGYISRAIDLENIPAGSTGTYIVTADLVAISDIQIESFNGNFYGNHHTLSGYDISSNGGLFDHVEKAYITAFNMTNVTGAFTASYSDSVGVLANTVYDSNFTLCNVSGEISAEVASSAEEVLTTTFNVGGLIGYLNDDARKSESDISIDVVKYCVLNLNIDVKGNAKMYIGGIVGCVINATVKSSSHTGDINVEANSSPVLYIGGIAGSITKEMPTGNKLYSYDSASNLKSYGDITVDISGYSSSNVAYIGGIVGAVVNHNMVNMTRVGDITIEAEDSSVYVANVAAWATNNGSTSIVIPMEFSKITCDGKISASRLEGDVISSDVVAVTTGDIEIYD